MAEDALGGFLSISEEDGDAIPTPSKAGDIDLPEGASLILVEVNTDIFREAV